MAVALTLGSSALSALLQVLFDRMATPEFVNLFRKRKNDDELLEKLRRNLNVVEAVLDDAENKQTTNKAVKKWLDDLHDTSYEAEDLLDKINTEALGLKIETEYNQSPTNKVSAPTCTLSSINDFLNEITPKVEKIVSRLEGFKQDIQPLGLQNGEFKRQSYRPPSTSLVDETNIFGRDADKEKIIQLLLSEEANGGSITVVPIVGMGGIGKTTLAQMVYKDLRVKNYFSTKAWVCVSEEYDATRITKELLREINISFFDNENLNSLQVKIQAGLTDKKFLLVLDDVWNNDYNHWDNLRIPFKGGLRGSKIIVTTRDHNVARMMAKKESIHCLDYIVDKDCWLLFEKHAFENKDSNQNPKLEEIGKKIIKKCGGLPLAVKAVAGLLRSKTTEEEWEDILVSEVWSRTDYQGGILPALRLSYIHLPSHLKRCFAYCSVFHKDYNFRKEEVIQLWLANDLLEHTEDNKRIENIGEKCFHELRMRSLFQQSKSDKFFSMHDLVNDLARVVSAKYCLRLEDYHQEHGTIARINNFSYHPTHRYDTFHKFKLLMETKNLKTFLPVRMEQISSPCYALSRKFLHDTLPKCKSLRVLSLSNYHIVMLPESFSGLKQLRFLDLSSTKIRNLPDWICTLYNLQTLLLTNCKELEELPKDFGKLINLSYLDISGIPLKRMPLQVGKLRSLQVLTTFLVGEDSDSTIEELGKLPKLRSKLLISRLENVSSGRDASMANMKGKKQIEDLTLEWNDDIEDSRVARDVLNNLQPHSSIKHLKIDGYCGTTFPEWLRNPPFFHLEFLSLSTCENCLELPALGQLQSLQSLEIVGMRYILALTEEFYGDASVIKPFSSLKKFRIEKMPEWEKWHVTKREVFCSLEELCIIDCPKLTGELPKQLSSLQRLEISGCDKLVVLPSGRLSIVNEDIQQLPSLCELKISALKNLKELPTGSLVEFLRFRNCDSLKVVSLGSFPMLKRFAILECKSIEMLLIPPRGIGNQSIVLASLRSFFISGCHELVSFPEGGLPGANLIVFHVTDCKKLKSLPEGMESLLPSLEHLKIVNCPEIVCFPEGGFPSSLKYLGIFRCEKLMSRRKEWGLPRLPALRDLGIGGVESFPDKDWLLPCKLEFLVLSNIKTLNYSGLLQLTNLKRLLIMDCPLLQSLPDEGLPASLTQLEMWDCPLLKPRLEGEKGQDWPKAERIPFVRIEDELFP